MKPERSSTISNGFGPIGPPGPPRGSISSPFGMPDLLASFRATLAPSAPSPAPVLSPMATLHPVSPSVLSAPAPLPSAPSPPTSVEASPVASASVAPPSWASMASRLPASLPAPVSAPSGPTPRQQRAAELVGRTHRLISEGGGTPSGTPIQGAYPINYYPKRRYSSGTLLEAATQWRAQGAQFSARTGHLTDANPNGRYINLERTDPSPTGASATRHNVHVPEGKSK